MQIGDVIGRWTLNYRFISDKRAKWNCTCSCGTIRDVREDGLAGGISTSCGCYHREMAAEVVVKHSRKHGHCDKQYYKQYYSMLARCTNPKNPKFKIYGELEHCPAWLESFENFWSDMGDSYFDGASIDRLDNRKGYSKENCRWVEPLLQGRNKKISNRNTSGVNGVFWDVKNGNTYAKVVIYEDRKQRTKSFSVKKYGLLEAFALAVQYRKDQIARLNELGYGYTDTHGL